MRPASTKTSKHPLGKAPMPHQKWTCWKDIDHSIQDSYLFHDNHMNSSESYGHRMHDWKIYLYHFSSMHDDISTNNDKKTFS